MVAPLIGGQPYWAARLHRFGASPRPIPARRLSAPALTDRLRQATIGPTRTRAAALATRPVAEDGLRAAVDARYIIQSEPRRRRRPAGGSDDGSGRDAAGEVFGVAADADHQRRALGVQPRQAQQVEPRQ